MELFPNEIVLKELKEVLEKMKKATIYGTLTFKIADSRFVSLEKNIEIKEKIDLTK